VGKLSWFEASPRLRALSANNPRELFAWRWFRGEVAMMLEWHGDHSGVGARATHPCYPRQTGWRNIVLSNPIVVINLYINLARLRRRSPINWESILVLLLARYKLQDSSALIGIIENYCSKDHSDSSLQSPNGKSDMSSQKHEIQPTMHEENANLQHTRSAGAFTISPELFEKVGTLLSVHFSLILTVLAISHS